MKNIILAGRWETPCDPALSGKSSIASEVVIEIDPDKLKELVAQAQRQDGKLRLDPDGAVIVRCIAAGEPIGGGVIAGTLNRKL